jgi:precorrin-3B synthase
LLCDQAAASSYRGPMARACADDACPGALRVHQAADGALVRLRLPGGMLTTAQLATLAAVSTAFGSGTLELTTRGNVQLRGIGDAAAVADAVARAGLLPSDTHERVRNIVASPLSGRIGGRADVREWVTDLDAAIRAEPVLAQLPGRFWFSFDDGRCDVSALAADVGAYVLDDAVALLLCGRDTGVRLEPANVVETMVAVAVRFVKIRGKAWRIAELADLGALLPGVTLNAAPVSRVTAPPVGWIEQDDGRVVLGAAVPLGVLSASVAEHLGAIDAPLVITPWRSVLVCDLNEAVAGAALRVLAPMGLIFDENSPWLAISACVGSPGCARSAADVRADAAAAAHTAGAGVPYQRRHYVGCERACGSPPTGEVLVATGQTEPAYRALRSAAKPGAAGRHPHDFQPTASAAGRHATDTTVG